MGEALPAPRNLDDMSNKELIAQAYCKLLNSIDWEDEVLLAGLREGLTKFVSNAFLKLNGKNKYLQGDFYSVEARARIDSGDFTGLVYEHMVPKTRYIQGPCEEKAKRGQLNVSDVLDLLDRYWKVAVVTKEEDRLLAKSMMPDGWDGQNIFIRYERAGVKLVAANS